MTRLRTAVETSGRRPVVAIGAHNAVAARLIEEAGFECLWASSLELSAVRGLPDRNVLGASELADHVSILRQASALPIIADIDNAQGSPVMGERLGRELSLRGCDSVCIEDSAFPKANSFSALDGHELCSPETSARVINAIKEGAASRGQSLTVIARTEALIGGLPLDGALERMACYRDAGADILIAHSKDGSGEEALAVAAAWDGSLPLACIPTAFPHFDLDDLATAGYRLCIFANHLLRAAIAAMQDALDAVRVAGRLLPKSGLVSMQRLFTLTDAGTVSSVEGDDAMLRPERLNVMDDIAAFVSRWDSPEVAPLLETVKLSAWGNRNTTGEPGKYTAPDFTPHDPQFAEVIEPGIRPIVLEAVDAGFITYTSCDGHAYPAELMLDPVERNVRILPRSDDELRAARGWLQAAAEGVGDDYAVAIAVRDEILRDKHGRRVDTIELVFEPKEDWRHYFDAIERVTEEFHRSLVSAAIGLAGSRQPASGRLDRPQASGAG